MFIDTHCHLSSEYYDDIQLIIDNAKKNHVNNLIISGCDKKGIEESIEIANNNKNIYLALGYHPSEVNTTTDEDIKKLKSIVQKNKQVVAIGEIGLDYHWEKENKEAQKKLFKKQLELAKELDLPVVIHSRDAFQDTYDILKESKCNGVIHCFTGNLNNAQMYLSLGFYLGIGGVLTFKNTNLKETIKDIPINKILLETDSPYLAPTPYRGQQNCPEYIPLIAQELSNILEKDINYIAKQTTENANKLFKLNIKTEK